MSLGKIDLYKVNRETNLGYVLVKDGEEFFLHHNECAGKILEPGESVKAFLYMDKKNRLAATLFTPTMTLCNTALVKVVGVRNELGIFCSIGISKDILISCDDLPNNTKEWPKEGDFLPCTLKSKNNRLLLKIASKSEILSNLKKEERLTKDSLVIGYVYRTTPEGINLVTEDYEVIFVYKTNYRKTYRLGEKVEVQIVDVHEDDYSGKVNRNKEFQIHDDVSIITSYLEKNNGVMLITEKSDPQLINQLFHMSKSSFKNALGNLLKAGKIKIMETKIILLDSNND